MTQIQTQTQEHLQERSKYLHTVESILLVECERPQDGGIYLDIELWQDQQTGKKFYKETHRTI